MPRKLRCGVADVRIYRRALASGILLLTCLCGTALGQRATGELVSTIPSQRLSEGASETAGIRELKVKLTEGSVTVVLPEVMAAGDQVSASLFVEPGGGDDPQKQRNRERLATNILEAGDARVKLSEIQLKFRVPTPGAASLALVLRDPRAKELKRFDVPLVGTPAGAGPAEFAIPKYASPDEPLVIAGPFDGDFATTAIQVAGAQAKVLAESPRQVVFYPGRKVAGLIEIGLRERDLERRQQVRLLVLDDSTNMFGMAGMGSSCTHNLTISGLEGLTESVDVFLDIERACLPFANLYLRAGRGQALSIRPDNVKGGVLTLTRQVSISPEGKITVAP